MAKGRVIGTTYAVIAMENAEDAKVAVAKLSDVKPEYRDGLRVDSDDRYVYIDCEEYGTFYSCPAVYYTANGDGSPAEYEDDLCWANEDDVKDFIQNSLKGMDYDIEELDFNTKYPDENMYW